MNIVQITPRFAPSVCGVGDYSRLLGGAMETRCQVRSRYLVADLARGASTEPGAAEGVHALGTRNAATWVKAIRELRPAPDAVVLQASFYGFNPHGVPLWLAQALETLQASDGPPVLTMFHELYASGPVVSRAYWYGRVQRWLARRVANVSTGVRTNRKASWDWLAAHTRHAPDAIPCLPVFSNLGESRRPAVPASSRAPVMIAPGMHPGSPAWPSMLASARQLQCTEIFLTGPELHCSTNTPSVQGIHVTPLGILPAHEYSALMSRARFGFLDYNPLFLAKSGHFAAFAAHGVIPVVAAGGGQLPDGLDEDRHFLAGGSTAIPSQSLLDSIGQSVISWYQHHDIGTTAESYHHQLQSMLEPRS